VSAQSKKSKKAARSQRSSRSRAALYAEISPEVEEPAGAEAAFAPAFGDFDVPAGVARAWEEFAGEGAGTAGPDGCEPARELGRVVRLDRGYPLVVTGQGSFRAEHAAALVKGADVRAVVGDWVVLDVPGGHDKARIEQVLPRQTRLSRWDGRPRGERQVLAANVDVLVVAQPLSKRGVSCDRAARSVVLAREGGMEAAVVLTKADRVSADELGRALDEMRRAVGGRVAVLAVSSLEGTGVEEVRALVPTRGTALLLGESGAGKSTLVNALLGVEVLGVGAVRDRDDQGRHTTVARRMLKVPGAGVLVDAPGLRSLPLLDEDRGLARAYPEIDALVEGCRFRDCAHGDEPGCAVRAGVARGEVDEVRLEQYRALAAEMYANRRALDPSAPASLTR
jgi:ribosome biogenesis GTPase